MTRHNRNCNSSNKELHWKTVGGLSKSPEELLVELQWISADGGNIANLKEREQESETGMYENGNKRGLLNFLGARNSVS
jgi:hypothetical protein